MILITGVTGHVGFRIAELLFGHKEDIRLMARSPDKVPRFGGTDVAISDYANSPRLEKALAGCHTVFLASAYGPPGERCKLHMNVIDAAKAVGVERIVYLSFQGASERSAFPYSTDHWLTEQHLRSSGLDFTILRDSFYLELLPEMADATGIIRGPAGDGKVAWVSREDVAQTAATVLRQSSHSAATYDLTGPEAIDLTHATERLSAISGRHYGYENETIEGGRGWRAASGAPEWEVEVWLGSYLAIAAGEVDAVSDTIQRLTGRRPFDLELYFEQHPERLAAKREV